MKLILLLAILGLLNFNIDARHGLFFEIEIVQSGIDESEELDCSILNTSLSNLNGDNFQKNNFLNYPTRSLRTRLKGYSLSERGPPLKIIS